VGMRGSFPRIRGWVVKLTATSSAEVKNTWSYNSTPPKAFMLWCSVKKSQEQIDLYF